MANETYGRTYKIDTAGADVIHAGPFFVKYIRWVASKTYPKLTHVAVLGFRAGENESSQTIALQGFKKGSPNGI